MKLTFYTAESFEKVKPSPRPMFSISTGNILKINKPLVDLLKVQAGDMIIIGQDEKHGKDWYIARSLRGFTLKPAAGTDQSLAFSFGGLVNLFRAQFPKHEKMIKIPVAPDSTFADEEHIYFALLTAAIEKP
ncbi:hypothetical protein GGR92_004819 [Spirosoma lacussanchae]|uniref:hypothetical protein n=1 Tax=Spirosoma lacussanchae TaxID=1884249 RepID=UPI0011093B78|nr:hypothetical protein [Spirosoma lacussanchae]